MMRRSERFYYSGGAPDIQAPPEQSQHGRETCKVKVKSFCEKLPHAHVARVAIDTTAGHHSGMCDKSGPGTCHGQLAPACLTPGLKDFKVASAEPCHCLPPSAQ